MAILVNESFTTTRNTEVHGGTGTGSIGGVSVNLGTLPGRTFVPIGTVLVADSGSILSYENSINLDPFLTNTDIISSNQNLRSTNPIILSTSNSSIGTPASGAQHVILSGKGTATTEIDGESVVLDLNRLIYPFFYNGRLDILGSSFVSIAVILNSVTSGQINNVGAAYHKDSGTGQFSLHSGQGTFSIGGADFRLDEAIYPIIISSNTTYSAEGSSIAFASAPVTVS